MTMPRAIEVQKAIFEAVFAALDPIPVASTPLAADRYVRVDGLTLTPLPRHKNYDAALHAFFVHSFDSPDSGTNSYAWAVSTLAQVDAVLRDLKIPGASGITLEDMQVSFPPRADGKLDAHAFARYSLDVGEI